MKEAYKLYLQYLRHLRMAHIFIYNNSFDQHCVIKPPTFFAFHLNKFKVYIFPFQICNRKYSFHCNLCQLPVTSADTGNKKENNKINI